MMDFSIIKKTIFRAPIVEKTPVICPKPRGERHIKPCAETPVIRTPQKFPDTSSSASQEASNAGNGVGLAMSNEITAKETNNVREPFDEDEKGGRFDASRDELQEEYEPETEYEPEEEFEPDEFEPEDDVVNHDDGKESELEDGSAGEEEEEIVNLSEGDDVDVVEEVEYFSDELESEGDTLPNEEEGGAVHADDSLCCGEKEFMCTGNQKVESDLENDDVLEEKETVMAKEIHCFRKELENNEDDMLGNDKARADADGKDGHKVRENRYGKKNLELFVGGNAHKRLQKRDIVLGCDRPAKVSLAYHHIDSRKKAKAQDGTARRDILMHEKWGRRLGAESSNHRKKRSVGYEDKNSGIPKLCKAAASPPLKRSYATKSSDSFHHKKHMKKHYGRQYNLPPRKRLAPDYIPSRNRHAPDQLPPTKRHAPDQLPPRKRHAADRLPPRKRHTPDHLPSRRRHAPDHDYQVRKAHKEYTFQGPRNSTHLFSYHTQRSEYMEETYSPRFLCFSATHRQAHFYDHDSNFGSKHQYTTVENVPPSCSDTPVHRPRAYMDSHQYYTSDQYRDVYCSRPGRSQVINDRNGSRYPPSWESHHYGVFGQDTVCAEGSSDDIPGRICPPHYNDEYIYTVRDSLYPFHRSSRGSGGGGVERSGFSHY